MVIVSPPSTNARYVRTVDKDVVSRISGLAFAAGPYVYPQPRGQANLIVTVIAG